MSSKLMAETFYTYHHNNKSTDHGINKLEKVQKRGIKWILKETNHHYNDLEYLSRLRDLSILPLESKFLYNDLVIFYRIFYGNYPITFPSYLEFVSCEDLTRLRSSHLDETCLKCIINPRVEGFRSSYFYRTHAKWNLLPAWLKRITSLLAFKTHLKKYFWSSLLEPD